MSLTAPIAEPGKHSFDGAFAPGATAAAFIQDTFSVGVFEWLPKASGKGCKRGSVKLRIKGAFCAPEYVYAKAREVAAQLDAGTYRGPKNVSV